MAKQSRQVQRVVATPQFKIRQALTDKPRLMLLLDFAQITLGLTCIALAYNLFYIPNNVVCGGLSGLGIIINYLWGFPVGLAVFILNVPLFLAGLRWAGGVATGIRTVYGIIMFSVALDVLARFTVPVTDNPLLYITYGGLLDGIGVGLVLRANGTTGGTDIIGRLARQFFGTPISRAAFIFNAGVIVLAAVVFGLELAMYGVLVAAIVATVVDFVLSGGRRARQMLIISREWEAVQDVILQNLERGVTLLQSTGAYTGSERPILMVVINRNEEMPLRRALQAIDPHAFVIVSMALEVWGEGFTPIEDEIG